MSNEVNCSHTCLKTSISRVMANSFLRPRDDFLTPSNCKARNGLLGPVVTHRLFLKDELPFKLDSSLQLA